MPVAVLLQDDAGRLLLVRHRLRGWELPGGKLEPGESWADAARREVLEETGLRAYLFADPLDLGEVVIALGFAQGTPAPADDLIVEARWFARTEVPLDQLSDLPSAAILRRYCVAGALLPPA